MEMLSLIHEMLPPVTTLVTCSAPLTPADSGDRCQRHYAIVESDHPYKHAAVNNYRVTSLSRVCHIVTISSRCLSTVVNAVVLIHFGCICVCQ